jgi:hypothetical protein
MRTVRELAVNSSFLLPMILLTAWQELSVILLVVEQKSWEKAALEQREHEEKKIKADEETRRR